MELLPHDIISRDFEAEPWKYSSHMDYTIDNGILWSALYSMCVKFLEVNYHALRYTPLCV